MFFKLPAPYQAWCPTDHLNHVSDQGRSLQHARQAVPCTLADKVRCDLTELKCNSIIIDK